MFVFALGDSKMIAGTATHGEGNALKPNSIFEAVLEDSSGTDLIATRIGEYRIENPKLPICFVIPYDPGQIRKGHTYTVRAKIEHDNQSLFATKSHYRVLKRPDDVSVNLRLRRTECQATDVWMES